MQQVYSPSEKRSLPGWCGAAGGAGEKPPGGEARELVGENPARGVRGESAPRIFRVLFGVLFGVVLFRVLFAASSESPKLA